MKRFLLALLLVCGVAYGDTTGNLITNTWNGAINYSGTGGGTSGGASAGYNSSTNTIYFGYTQQQVNQLIGINTALQGTGIQVNGYNWSWDIYNNNSNRADQYGIDTLTATINTLNSSNVAVHTFSQTYNTKFDWTTFSGTQTCTNPYLATDLSSLQVQFSGMDSGYWAGYYGPQVRNVNVSLNYTVDQCAVNPQSSPSCPGYKTYYNMWDDGYAQVNLPFVFPFYGQLFTTSYMYTNGVVGFLNNNWGFCCDGTDLNNQASQQNSPWNYAIYALNTDLIPGPNSEFYTQVTDNGTGLKYSWVNVPEIGTALNNTFHVQIKDSGYIGITYDQVNLNPWRNPLVGIAGNISQGQYSITYYGQASGLPALAGTTNVYTGTETTDVCAVNPLYNTSCPGYAAAYLSQQCSINSLYDPSCPGYAAAYLSYQCSINSLYSTTCPGYEQAYFDQQCSISALYDSGCPGYEQAYFDQQCTLDGLYSNQCPNYAEAYALKYVVNTNTSTTTTTSIVSTTEATATVSSDGTVKTEVSKTGDSTVDSVITTTTVSASPSSATAAVQLAPTTSSNQPTQTAQATEQKQEAKQDDSSQNSSKKEESKTESASSSNKSDSGKSSDTKSAKAEARKQAVAKAGKDAQNDMDSAQSMQAQVAVQGVVIAAMGYTPGFDAYKFILPDAPGYRPFEIYKKQRNVDNARTLRGLTGASDRLHDQMVMEQYQ